MVTGTGSKPGVLVRGMSKIPWVAVAFLAPSILAFLLFKYYPMVQAVYMSFFQYSIMNPPGPFIGLHNYSLMLQSTQFWQAAYNTFVFFMLYLLITFWIPIVQALFLNEIRKSRLNLLFRFMYLVPTAVPGVAAVLLWKWMYNPDYGLINAWLGHLGLGPYGWLNDPAMAKISIVLPGIMGGGIGMLLYYSALQGLSEEVVEASKIDGAGPWQRMRYIIVPHLRFIVVIQFILFLATILLSFDAVYVMTGGGPAGSTQVLSMLVYDSAFKQNQFGIASAVSFMLFIVIAIITFIQLRVERVER